MDKKIKITELPTVETLTGAVFLATDAQGNSVKVPYQTLVDAIASSINDDDSNNNQ